MIRKQWQSICVPINYKTKLSHFSTHDAKGTYTGYHIVGKFGKLTLFEHLAKQSLANQ